jgi:MATE family multidrug resistance protein
MYNAASFKASRPVNRKTAKRNHSAEIWRTLQLAAPVMVGLIASFGMNFVDTVMAGRLPEKDVALAALAIGGAMWSAMLMFTLGTLMALQPTVAQLDGAGLHERAGEALRQAFWIAVVLAVPFAGVLANSGPLLHLLEIDPTIIPTSVEYLEAMAWGAPAMCLVFLLRFFSEGTGHTRPTMYIGLIGILLNIPLNWILMFGNLGMPALGARGCGYATAIVIWMQVAALLIYIRAHHHFRRYQPFSRWDWPKRRIIVHLLRVGLPIAVTIFVEGSLFVAAALLIGRLGPIPAAGHLVAINFAALVFMVPLGLASAVTTRTGNALGRGDPGAARYAGMIGLFIVLCTQTLSAIIMVLAPGLVVGLYTNDPAIAAVAVSLLYFAAIFQFPDGIQVVCAGALRGFKDTMVPALYNIISYWLVGLTLGYYLTFERQLGPEGMWIGMIGGLTSGSIFLFGRFIRRSGKIVRASVPVAQAG